MPRPRNDNANQPPLSLFVALSRIFWLLWLMLPVTIALIVFAMIEPTNLVSGLSDEQRRCLDLFPRPGNLSTAGSAIFWTVFALGVLPYVAMMLVMHRTVRRFAQGRVLVDETLSALRLTAIILIVWPFLELVADNAASWALKATGDVNFTAFDFSLELAPLAGGLFMLAMGKALEHAIAAKTENDLTI